MQNNFFIHIVLVQQVKPTNQNIISFSHNNQNKKKIQTGNGINKIENGKGSFHIKIL